MTETTIAPDASASWYSEREARIQAERSRVDAQSQLVENAHNALSERWNQLEREQEDAHDNMGITPEASSRALINIERERQRLLGEADQLKNGYEALQAEKSQLERAGKLDYQTLVDNSSEKSKLFLQVFRSKIEHDPAALRRLLHANSVARASNIPVDSNDYFASIERHMGFKPEERRFEFENEHGATKEKPAKQEHKTQATEAQKVMARNLPGVDEQDYLKACAQPFSQASQTVSVEPDELNFDQNSKSMEVSLDEAPKKATVDASRYKPGPSSVTLSPVEKDICVNMASVTGRPVNEVLKDFAKQKLALHSGKAPGYQLYADKMRSEGRA